MAELRDRVAAELENVEKTLREIPAASRCPSLSPLELAGVAALLHNFYNGIENILKQVLQSRSVPIPTGDSWHRDLLALAAEERILRRATVDALKRYLAFRHFFSHAYALDLAAPRMEALVADVNKVFEAFNQDTAAHLAPPPPPTTSTST